MELTEVEKAYIAGIIDGEGSIYIIQRTNQASFECNLSVSNTSLPLIVWLSEKLDKHYWIGRTARGNQAQAYNITLKSRDAIVVLNMLLPYLIVKKDLALLMVAFPLSVQGERTSDEQYLKQAIIYRQAKDLQTRGKSHVN